MEQTVHRTSILKKTAQVGVTTALSRALGLVREIALIRFLGIGAVHDAFTTAYMLPNSLRKIFAEGALTAAFVPTLVNVFKKNGQDEASSLTTFAFIIFESLLFVLCALVMWKAEFTIRLIASGYGPEQIAVAVPCLRILMPFILFISI